MTIPEISLVIPVYNEQENLPELTERCVAVCEELGGSYEIILIDDGSRDKSREIIRSLVARNPGTMVGLFFNRNYGQHPAVLAGLAESRGQVVVTLDADLQNPPEEIPKLLGKISEGCDVVGSVRRNRNDSLFRRWSSQIVNMMVRKSTGVMMTDFGCMLRAYRRNVVDAVLQCPEFSTFIPILANGFAARTAEVEVNHSQRGGGQSKYNLWKLVNLQFDLLTSMTSFPLRLLFILGGILALCGFAAGLTLLIARAIYGPQWAADGVFTIFAGLFLFAGVQLLGLGLVGEYLGRVYNDVRGRPRYFVEEKIGAHTADRSGEESDVINLTSKRKH